LREGVDDVRYAMTLESLLEDPTGPAETVRKEYQAWLKQVQEARPRNADVPRFRDALVDFILRLKR
jgi:hypothetical protein